MFKLTEEEMEIMQHYLARDNGSPGTYKPWPAIGISLVDRGFLDIIITAPWVTKLGKLAIDINKALKCT